MTKPKLSNWSAPGEKPPCVGVWKTDYNSMQDGTFQWFNGVEFCCASASPFFAYANRFTKSNCNQSTVRFRGLAEKPE